MRPPLRGHEHSCRLAQPGAAVPHTDAAKPAVIDVPLIAHWTFDEPSGVPRMRTEQVVLGVLFVCFDSDGRFEADDMHPFVGDDQNRVVLRH